MTDSDGGYSFTGLAPGDYSVTFVDPDGRDFTVNGAGDGDDSNAAADGTTGIITLEAGEFNPTIDAGIVPASLLSSPPLAFTGSNSVDMALFALMLFVVGLMLVAGTRRRRPVS